VGARVIFQLRGNETCEPSGTVDVFATLAFAWLSKERPLMLMFPRLASTARARQSVRQAYRPSCCLRHHGNFSTDATFPLALPTVLPVAMATLPIQLLLPDYYPVVRPLNLTTIIAGAAQWVSQRLTRLVRPLRASSRLGVFALPPEIILMITTHLNNSAIVSLALTCRTLRNLCLSERSHLDKADKEELLLLLEKDVASLYFCHYCTKLHHWHTRWTRSVFPWYAERMSCKANLNNHLFFPTNCHIPYYYARLVMNRHFYGPAHGPPVHQLEERTRSGRHLDGVVVSVSQHARIVDDQLLVLTVISMSHSRGDSASLRNRIDSLGHSVCSHLTLQEGYPDGASVQLPELAKDRSTPNLFQPCTKAYGSCTSCLTDYNVDISWKGEKRGFGVKVFIYRQLGDCRSPFDWSWRTISDLRPKEDPRTARSLFYERGYVRDQWNKIDGDATTSRGNWAQTPNYATSC
jgi:hypothetical protein